MTEKQVTIFGGTGFIGRYVVQRLADMGYTIHVASRRAGMVSFLKPAGNIGQIVPVLCDVHSDKSIKEAIKGSDTVINLIGILVEGRKKNTFKELHQDFPKRLGKIAKKANIDQLVHVSSIGADKDAPSRYLKTKGEGEKALRKTFPKAVVLRPSVVFGAEDQFFNRFARMAMISPVLPLVGGGHTKFQPVYVCDVADAIIKSVTDTSCQGNIYELGGPDIMTFRQLLEMMLDYIGRQRWLISLPWKIAAIKGYVLQRLPGKLLTRDQVRSLRLDSVVADDVKTLDDLGIKPTPLALILPTYLDRFKLGGRFGIEVKEETKD